jgi:hypothetical protein
VPAGASTGTAQISPEQAGYTATGAQFEDITADVYLRQQGQYAGEVATFAHSVQLWSSGLVAVVGVTASTSGSGYTPYAKIYDRSTHQVLASNPNAIWCDVSDDCSSTIGTIPPGEGVSLSVTYDLKTRDLGLRAIPYIGNGGFVSIYTAASQSFTQARVGTEFGSSPWDASYAHTPPANYAKIATYNNVALTTYSGHIATLWSWWVHHKLLANTGQQTGSDWVATPGDLTNGGASFQTGFVPQSAQSSNQPAAP